MLYNNDPKKVEALDQMLFEELCPSRLDGRSFLEQYEKEYLIHVISGDRLDALIAAVKEALNKNNIDLLRETLRVNNRPVLYKGNLVYGISKYLHWFRGYYYQMSGTPEGYYTVQAPYFWMRDLLHVVNSTERFTRYYPHVEEFVLSLSAMTTGLFYYDKTKLLLSTPSGVAEFDAFLTENFAKHFPYKTHFDTQSVLDRFQSYNCPNIPSDVLVSGAVLLSNSYDRRNCAVLALSDTEITVVLKKRNGYEVVAFELPEWYTDPDLVYQEDFEENPYKENPYALECIIQFVLMYSGVRVSSDGFFSMDKGIDVSNPIAANIPVLHSADQLDGLIAKVLAK